MPARQARARPGFARKPRGVRCFGVDVPGRPTGRSGPRLAGRRSSRRPPRPRRRRARRSRAAMRPGSMTRRGCTCRRRRVRRCEPGGSRGRHGSCDRHGDAGHGRQRGPVRHGRESPRRRRAARPRWRPGWGATRPGAAAARCAGISRAEGYHQSSDPTLRALMSRRDDSGACGRRHRAETSAVAGASSLFDASDPSLPRAL